MVDAALLDIDGTLVLSNDQHAQAWVDAYAEHGYKISFEQVRPLIGMGGDKLMARLTPQLDETEGEGKAIAQRRKQIFATRYADDLVSAPGARALIQYMCEAGVRLIVATSAKPDELKLLLKAAQVDDFLTEATTSDDANESKPDPDIVSVALDRLGTPPERAIMIGDTPYDVESASRCGVGVIALRCGGWEDAKLKRALAIYDSPADLLEHYAHSPLNS